MGPCFRTSRRIEFSDTDVAGIVHFSRFYVFMETAEHRFLNHLGTSVHAHRDGLLVGWPRLSASCEFFRPVGFEDVVDIELSVLRLGEKSITYGAEFSHDGKLVARGKCTSVCCQLNAGERPRSMVIPDQLRQRIEAAIASESSPQELR